MLSHRDSQFPNVNTNTFKDLWFTTLKIQNIYIYKYKARTKRINVHSKWMMPKTVNWCMNQGHKKMKPKVIAQVTQLLNQKSLNI